MSWSSSVGRESWETTTRRRSWGCRDNLEEWGRWERGLRRSSSIRGKHYDDTAPSGFMPALSPSCAGFSPAALLFPYRHHLVPLLTPRHCLTLSAPKTTVAMSGEGPENGKEKEEEEAVGGTCYICETGIRDPDLLGDMEQTVLRKPGRKSITINCHYFCLLFSCNLRMNGQEGEGIRGFLAEDIEKERNRGRSLTCYFCHKTGPTSACCEKTCKVAYHLPCALYLPDKLKSLVPEGFIKESKKSPIKKPAVPGPGNTIIRFVDPYETFCSNHRPPKKVESVNVLTERARAATDGYLTCNICLHKLSIPMVCAFRYQLIQCPHCLSCQHTDCVRPYARSAGEAHLMCPDCQCSRLDAKTDDTPAKIKDKIKCQQEYVDYCRRYGVYVPVKDAAWEEDDTYFEDQKAEYGQCDQDPCLCPDGNKYDDWDPVTKDKSGKWYIVLCSVCAGSGSHRQCGAIAVTDDWICNTCKAVVRKQKEENDEPQAEEAEEQGNGVKDIDDGNIDKEHDEDDEVVVNLDHEDVEGEASQQAGESSEAVPDVPHGSETTESMLDLEAEEGEKRKLDSGGDDHEDEPSRKKAKNMDNNHLN